MSGTIEKYDENLDSLSLKDMGCLIDNLLKFYNLTTIPNLISNVLGKFDLIDNENLKKKLYVIVYKELERMFNT